MEKATTNLNIYQKMLTATDKINRVAKNLKVGVGQSTYKAVGEADVLEAVKPVEVELGIYSFPFSRKVIDTSILTTSTEFNGKTTEKNSLFLRLETVYRFVNTENPAEYIDITTYGDGIDSQDKAVGKAMTYSDKYALLKAYKIETGDDPDQKASGQVKPSSDYRTIVLNEAVRVGIDLDKLAIYYKKDSIDGVTVDEIKKAIEVKRGQK